MHSGARANVPVEINLKGMKHGRLSYREGWRYAYPWARFWQIAGTCGASAVYGLDAHDPKDFAQMTRRIEEANTFLDLSGVRVITQWEQVRLGKRGRR